MIVAVDVYYLADSARAAAVFFSDWRDERPAAERVVVLPGAAAYEPGAFYKRELPALLAVLEGQPFDVAVVDGYVWLGEGRPGLGAHLHGALGRPVVGVAKTRFATAMAIEVVRAGSARPLYVTAIGLTVEAAAAHVQAMHGAHRLPTLLKRADRLSRGR